MEDLDKKIKTYKPPQSAIDILDNNEVVFLVGITGAGKDTVLRKLLKNPDYQMIVSHTTRAPRANDGVMEVEGREYYFIDLKRAEEMIDDSKYTEVKWVHGRVNGTTVAELKKIIDAGKIPIGDIEVQGVAEYCSISKHIVPIFILPPDFDTWLDRLTKRYHGKIDSDDLNTRLRNAQYELTEAIKHQYYEYVINDDLDTAVKNTSEIINGQINQSQKEYAIEIAKDLLTKLDEYFKQN